MFLIQDDYHFIDFILYILFLRTAGCLAEERGGILLKECMTNVTDFAQFSTGARYSFKAARFAKYCSTVTTMYLEYYTSS